VERETDNRHDGLERGYAEMDIGDRLKQLRELKGVSQGEIEVRSGLFRCYISRVENGHIVPVVETLEKFARALDVPLYQLLYEGEKPPKPVKTQAHEINDWASRGKGRRIFSKLQNALQKMSVSDRALLLYMAAKIGGKKSRT
jgi:transcriptional regulator with XRE-family HTH domain